MRTLFLMGMGAACAALVSLTSAHAQDTSNANINQNQTITNHGIPHQPPAIGLSSIYGLNPCSTGASLAVSTPLFGIGGAIDSIDRECETRNNAAVTITALHDEGIAREILCNINDFRQAAVRVGSPCLVDKKTSLAAAVSMPSSEVPRPVATMTQGSVPSNTVEAAARPPALDKKMPAFCSLPGLERGLYAACGGTEPKPSTVSSGAPGLRRGISTTSHDLGEKRRLLNQAAQDNPASSKDFLQSSSIVSDAEVITPTRLAHNHVAIAIAPTLVLSSFGVVPNPLMAREDASMAALLERRGDEMLALKDVSAARKFYESAANAGNLKAAAQLAKTYEPEFLASLGGR